MPSFPLSVFNPASKTSGQTIQAAHVNDLQDEVVAIEGALINGTAAVHASSLTVTGGALLNALPYTFPASGGSTGQVLMIDSTSGPTMGLKWASAAASVPDAARVQLDNEMVANAGAGDLGISWTQQTFVTNSSMHSTTTNSSRLTPQSTGVYLATLNLHMRATGGDFIATIKDSSGGIVAAEGASTSLRHHVSGLKRFDALGGYLTATITVGTSSNGLSTGANTHFSMVKL